MFYNPFAAGRGQQSGSGGASLSAPPRLSAPATAGPPARPLKRAAVTAELQPCGDHWPARGTTSKSDPQRPETSLPSGAEGPIYSGGMWTGWFRVVCDDKLVAMCCSMSSFEPARNIFASAEKQRGTRSTYPLITALS